VQPYHTPQGKRNDDGSVKARVWINWEALACDVFESKTQELGFGWEEVLVNQMLVCMHEVGRTHVGECTQLMLFCAVKPQNTLPVCLFMRAGELIQLEGQQFINQWIRPHFWFIIYADPHTCNSSEAPPHSLEGVEYEMIFLNPDSAGTASDHFGDDLRGECSLTSSLPSE